MTSLAMIGNAMWIFGLAIILVTLGWQLWESRSGLVRSHFVSSGAVLDCGAFLVCLGVALAASQAWARVMFALLSAALAALTITDLRQAAKDRS
jgi:CHASE2 domain-containing sensor protein